MRAAPPFGEGHQLSGLGDSARSRRQTAAVDAESADRGPGGPFPAGAARDEAVSLIRLAALDAELERLRGFRAEILGGLERQRSDLAALAELIESDRARLERSEHESADVLHARRRLRRNEQTHVELTRALGRDEGDALAMSGELQRRTADFAEQREALLVRVSSPLRDRYEAALREGQRPALVAVQDGRCPGCGEPMPALSRGVVQQSPRVAACSGCLRLLFGPGGVERVFMPLTLRRVPKAQP